jgi:methionine sulfoxide reductase heme-binding subunit
VILASSKLAWYVARSSGLIAWATVTTSMLWGLALSTRLVRRKGAPAWLLDLHRFLGTLSLVFTGVHIAGIVADNFVHFGIADILVPMATTWHPKGSGRDAVVWGIASMYLLIAIQITSWLRKRLSRRVWHAIHLASFPLFIASTLHGFRAGHDRGNALVIWMAMCGGMALVFFVGARIGLRQNKRRMSGVA